MRRRFFLCFALLLGLVAAAEDRVSWEITPRIAAPGQPFRLQIIVESDVILGGAQQAGREIKPPRGMALRLSGQIVRSDSNEATINYSGVAPDQEGEYVIPPFNLRFARKIIAVEAIKLIVSKSVAFRRDAQARAELVIPDRTFYVGELIRGAIRLRGGEEEAVVASFGLESLAEGFTFAVTGDRQALPDELGQGMQTPSSSPRSAKASASSRSTARCSSRAPRSTRSATAAATGPSPSDASSPSSTCPSAAAPPIGPAPSGPSSRKPCRSPRTSRRSANPSACARSSPAPATSTG
jgi:hypothetical protein